jgi:type IV pilus assembly protein PilA
MDTFLILLFLFALAIAMTIDSALFIRVLIRRGRRQHGFTLIELMVVVSIIGLLAAIAVPQFTQYRKKAFDAAAKSDLKNAAVTQEAFWGEHGKYTDSIDELKAAGAKVSQGVEMSASVNGDDFTLTAKATPCAPGTGEYTYSNVTGRVEGKVCR